jgi:hypothetical protein
MAEFVATVACNGPRVADPQAVERILASYYFDADLKIGVAFDHEDGQPRLFCYGHFWPEAWPLEDGESRDDFDPIEEDCYEDGEDGFEDLLIELAQHLEEPLIVQAIGSTKCLYPLAACSWRIEPHAEEVRVAELDELVAIR